MDEIVIKTPLFRDECTKEELFTAYDSILNETQTLKVVAHSEYLTQIKEEIVEVNPESQLIVQYAVIVEQAQNTL